MRCLTPLNVGKLFVMRSKGFQTREKMRRLRIIAIKQVLGSTLGTLVVRSMNHPKH